MADGIYVALSGAIAQSMSLDSTSQNLANASTDGYQRMRPVFREELSRAGSLDPALHYSAVGMTQLDTTRGELRDTGRALDFAMPQGTYLAVSTSNGERYTRAASLSVGIDGTLRTPGGASVLNDGGTPIRLSGDGASVSIDDTGQVRQGDAVVGRVKLVSFDKPSALTHDQGPLLMATAESGAATASRGPLEIGHVETSNANVVNSMTDLVTASRTFEAFQRVIDTFRDEDRKVVTTVPSVSS
jgi:flagellar basal-body rod protein FlgF